MLTGLTTGQLITALNTHARQKKVKELHRLPCSYSLLDQLSYEFDDEDELMNAAEDIIYDQSVIFI